MRQTTKKISKKVPLLIGTLVLAALLAVFAWVYSTAMPNGQAGSKSITVQVITETQTENITINTDAEFLRGALEQEDLVSGTESEYGLFVSAVNGIAADESKQQWWCFTKGGGVLYTGIDTTPIADGDSFEATLMTGW